MGKKYRSDALAAVHEAALGLTEAGVMNKRTMKAFDEMCLTPVEALRAEQIRQIRLREMASQAVFARYLNVTTGLVSQRERGEIRIPREFAIWLTDLINEGLDHVLTSRNYKITSQLRGKKA
jgi:putative transcriptional regulator